MPRHGTDVFDRVAHATRSEHSEPHVGRERATVVARHQRGATGGAEGEVPGRWSAFQVACPGDDDVGARGVRLERERETWDDVTPRVSCRGDGSPPLGAGDGHVGGSVRAALYPESDRAATEVPSDGPTVGVECRAQVVGDRGGDSASGDADRAAIHGKRGVRRRSDGREVGRERDQSEPSRNMAMISRGDATRGVARGPSTPIHVRDSQDTLP